MEFMMGLVAKKHQAYNPYSFQTIACENKESLDLKFYEYGPLSMACSQGQKRPDLWQIGPDEHCSLRARFNKQPFRLEIEHDKWGTRPCFYLEDREKFVFSSDFNSLVKFMGNSASIDKQGVAKYLSSGVLCGGDTFFKNIKMLPSQHRLIFDRHEVVLEKVESSCFDLKIQEMNTQERVEGLVNCFEQSVKDWAEYYGVEVANLSGGADTRLILAALPEGLRSQITFLTDASPHLSWDEDQDVVIARQLASEFDLKHIIRDHSTTDKKESFKVQELPEKPKLSGNHGGEVLGLEVLKALDFYFNPESFETTNQVMSLLSPLNESFEERRERTFEFGFESLFQSFFTDIYDGGYLNDWTLPHQFIQRKLSPFWNSKLVDFVLALKDDFPQSYELYAHIYREYYREFMQVPFVSVITDSHPDFKKLEHGVDQKRTFKKKKDKLSFVWLEKQNARVGIFSPQFFNQLLVQEEESVLLERCLKINRWMDHLGMVAKKENGLTRLVTKLEELFYG